MNFLRVIHPEIILKEFNLTTYKESEKQSLKPERRRLLTQVKTDKIKAQFQHRHLRRRRWLRVPQMPVEFPQNNMVGQQRQHISELQFDKLPDPQSFSVRKFDSKTRATTCSDFPSVAILWIKEVGDGWFFGRVEILAISLRKIFQTLRCWARRLPLLWTRSSRIPNSNRRSASRNRKP